MSILCIYIYDTNFLEWKMFQAKVVDKIITHILRSVTCMCTHACAHKPVPTPTHAQKGGQLQPSAATVRFNPYPANVECQPMAKAI
jgi:hypothetical protein